MTMIRDGHCAVHGIARCTICNAPPRRDLPLTDTLAERDAAALRDALAVGRLAHVRDVCEKAIVHDVGAPGWSTTGGRTDRQWLAQAVLNILDGNIDAQITGEVNDG